MGKMIISFVALILSCGLAFGQAQYEVLWNFGSTTADGAEPLGSLIFDPSGNLYGTTRGGGTSAGCQGGCGTVFKLSPNQDGSWTESILYSFCTNYVNFQCLDGAFPQAGLVLDSKGNLYGTTNAGGTATCPQQGSGCGAVFELTPPSSADTSWTESVLYSFCASLSNNMCLDGALPNSQPALDGLGNLYATTSIGGTGSGAGGTVFELSPSQSGWTHSILYNFCSTGHDNACPDGSQPQAGVTFDKSGNLYGTTESGGAPNAEGEGTIYELSPGPNGWTETVLYSSKPPYGNGGILFGGVSRTATGELYTTFSAGGPNGASGGVLELGAGGKPTGFWFNGKDGGTPMSGVLLDSRHSVLYGTTYTGGTKSGGTVFSIVAPAQETVLYNFCLQPNCADGVGPIAGLVSDKSGNLYGITKLGGANGKGVVFEVIPPASPSHHVGSMRSLLSGKN